MNYLMNHRRRYRGRGIRAVEHSRKFGLFPTEYQVTLNEFYFTVVVVKLTSEGIWLKRILNETFLSGSMAQHEMNLSLAQNITRFSTQIFLKPTNTFQKLLSAKESFMKTAINLAAPTVTRYPMLRS